MVKSLFTEIVHTTKMFHLKHYIYICIIHASVLFFLDNGHHVYNDETSFKYSPHCN